MSPAYDPTELFEECYPGGVAEFHQAIRPALQGDPREVAEWAIQALRQMYGLTNEETACVLGCIAAILDEQRQVNEVRQARIDAGLERVCLGCGCSESRDCPGGCVWATDNLCSRCV